MKVAVFGQGKLGKPIADVLSEYHELCRVDPAVENGCSPVGAMNGADVSIIIVPTPSDDTGRFSSATVEKVIAEDIIPNLPDKRHVTIVTSTVMPGECDRMRNAYLRDNWELVYSPEFVELGNVAEGFRDPDVLLMGVETEWAASVTNRLYAPHLLDTKRTRIFHRMSLVEAELAKLLLNNFLATKLDFVNMAMLMCDANGADAGKVLGLVGADPRIGSAFMKPGFGHGGPCLTRDTRALVKVEGYRFPQYARTFLVDKIADQCGKATAVLGYTYKPDVAITEDSHVGLLIARLRRDGKLLDAYDPLVNSKKASIERVIEGADTVVIGVPYKEFDIDYGDRKVINPWGHFNA